MSAPRAGTRTGPTNATPDHNYTGRGRHAIINEYKTAETIDQWNNRCALAAELGGKILSTDYNLQKNAKLQGVAFLNINDLATALKPSFVPGEFMDVQLLRDGDDEGQAVGFLNDGTMVVVENARERIGQQVPVEVTSALQTNAGKMVFGKLRRQRKAASPS